MNEKTYVPSGKSNHCQVSRFLDPSLLSQHWCVFPGANWAARACPCVINLLLKLKVWREKPFFLCRAGYCSAMSAAFATSAMSANSDVSGRVWLRLVPVVLRLPAQAFPFYLKKAEVHKEHNIPLASKKRNIIGKKNLSCHDRERLQRATAKSGLLNWKRENGKGMITSLYSLYFSVPRLFSCSEEDMIPTCRVLLHPLISWNWRPDKTLDVDIARQVLEENLDSVAQLSLLWRRFCAAQLFGLTFELWIKTSEGKLSGSKATYYRPTIIGSLEAHLSMHVFSVNFGM